MPKRVFRVREGEPLLDIVSYGRGGPRENGGRLAPDQIEQIRRTVQRAPEVMVKVLPRASNDFKAAGKHLDYISRYGRLALEADDGDRLEGQDGKAVFEEWDVDIDDVRRQATVASTGGRKPAKLVHKLMYVHLVLKSMSEQRVRLNIKKATLRHWRSEFCTTLEGAR